jgi:hypothetical protein
MSWNQAICRHCWRQREGERMPVRVPTSRRRIERCSFCGRHTDSGIYLRASAATLPYPRPDTEEGR